MQTIHKKSVDPAMRSILLNAYRSKVALAWDRAEKLQPQCGFGRLAICCRDCQDGPCRLNPFAEENQETICGRSQSNLVWNDFLQRTADGVAALAKLANQFGIEGANQFPVQLLSAADEMADESDIAGRLAALGNEVNRILTTFCRQQRELGHWKPMVSKANLGLLQSKNVNIVFHGHVDRRVIAGFLAAAETEKLTVTFSGLCGNEWSGVSQLAALTNYSSQEALLLTGLVDLLVTGGQCVMPAFYRLANQQKIPVLRGASTAAGVDYQEALQRAQQNYRRRQGKALPDNFACISAYTGYTADMSLEVFEKIIEQYRQEKLRGVVYLGGCGVVSHTQDEQPLFLANQLVHAGYLVVTAGCVGTALAKAGMCHPEWLEDYVSLAGVFPANVPPVIHLGACHDAGEWLKIAALLQQWKMPVAAIFPEINHHKVLATAVGFAAAGIQTWIDDDSLPMEVDFPELPLFLLTEKTDVLQAIGDKWET